MSLGFVFDKTIDPAKPLDPSDPAPEGWYYGIDTKDYRAALFGFPSDLFISCSEWNEREKERHHLRNKNSCVPA